MTTPESKPINLGDRVARIARDHYNGTLGTVIELGDRRGRAAGGGRAKPSLRVQWDDNVSGNTLYKGQRTWIALDAEGKRWKRLEVPSGG